MFESPEGARDSFVWSLHVLHISVASLQVLWLAPTDQRHSFGELGLLGVNESREILFVSACCPSDELITCPGCTLLLA